MNTEEQKNETPETGKEFRKKFLVYLIIALVLIITLDAVALTVTLVAIKAKNEDYYALVERSVLDKLRDGVASDIERNITEDMLKEYIRLNYLPEGYWVTGKEVYNSVRGAVVEVSAGETLFENSTGIIIDEQGFVLTSGHGVTYKSLLYMGNPGDETNYIIKYEAYSIIRVKYKNKEYTMNLIAFDMTLDLAILSFKDETPEDLPYVLFGSADTLSLGEELVAVGNTLGWGITVTTGVVSGEYEYHGADIIQTDALTLSGNSGGGVFNVYGELVGIITFAMSNQGLEASMGCAITIDEARDFIAKAEIEQSVVIPYTPSPRLP
jgi:Trypsin-like serine proteases, typically periplasmic, contain C-terminal PDZ domain